jgi:hypothetical protein
MFSVRQEHDFKIILYLGELQASKEQENGMHSFELLVIQKAPSVEQ